MSTFPPKQGTSKNVPAPAHVVENGPVSVGGGGIPASLKIKAAGTKDAPGLEKINSLA